MAYTRFKSWIAINTKCTLVKLADENVYQNMKQLFTIRLCINDYESHFLLW